MKKYVALMLMMCFVCFSFCGCSNQKSEIDSLNKASAHDVNEFTLDKVTLEKNKENCTETMTVYFRGNKVTKVEISESYKNTEDAVKAFDAYSNSKIYCAVRQNGNSIFYDYSDSLTSDSFKSVSSKEDFINSFVNDKGYEKK